MQEFTSAHDTDPCGTHLQTTFTASYADLCSVLGEHLEGDGYKMSTEWVFKNTSGEVVTLYDWKETEMYDESLPSVSEFRRQRSATWHIGARSSPVATDFVNWVKSKIGNKY
jgi:hypothetical protein